MDAQSPMPNHQWLADARSRHRIDLQREGASKSSQNSYPKRAEEFIQWCLATFGSDRASWPIDAPARWYTVRGWTGKAQTYCNIANSALRAAIRWDRNQSVGGYELPDFEFPPSLAPPKRKPKVYFAGEQTPMSTVPANSTPEIILTNGAPSPETAASPAMSMPAYLPPQTEMATPGVTERPLARPRTVEKRQNVIRNTLGAMLPPGGKLKVYRVSDGTDKQNPGDRLLLSEPTEKDVRGYNDIATWIKDTIHNVIDPLTGARTSTVTYIVENYDDQERLLPPPRKVALANATGQTAPTNGMFSSNTPSVAAYTPATTSASPPPGGFVDEVMKGFVRKMERVDQWQEEQSRNHAAVIEKARSGDVNGAQMQWFLSQKPSPIDVKALIEDVMTKVSGIVDKSKELTAIPPFMPSPKDPFDSPLLGKLVEAATKRDAPPLLPAPPDPVAQMTAMMNIVRPPVDPAITALQVQLSSLTHELRDAKAKNPNNDPMAAFTMVKLLDDMMDRRMQKFGGGSAGVTEAITAAITSLPETIRELAKAGVMEPRPGRPGAETTPAAPAVQQQPRKLPSATAEQIGALRAIVGGALKGDDALVLNNVMALIVANSTAPVPWPDLNKELYQAIAQDVTTVDELGFVIQRLYMLPAFGGGALLREFPGAVRRATDILAWNFPVICERLNLPARELTGIETAPVNSQTTQKGPPVSEATDEVENEEPVVVAEAG